MFRQHINYKQSMMLVFMIIYADGNDDADDDDECKVEDND